MIAYAVFLPTLVFAAIYDVKNRIIPDIVHLLILISGCIFIFVYEQPWLPRILAFLIVGTILLIAALRLDGIGGGDIKIMAAIVFAINFERGLTAIVLGLLIAMTSFIFVKNKAASIPLAPFLLIGIILALTVWRKIN